MKNKPLISVYIAMSLDGYIAKTDGNLDWLHYGHEGDEDYGFKSFMTSVDTLILGRQTYEVVSGFEKWPYTEKRVIVLSNSLKEVRNEAEIYAGNLKKLTEQLHNEGVRHIWVDGGVTVTKFLDAGLVDTLTISIIAYVLGSGIRLFSTMQNEQKCRLLSSKSYPSGLVQLKYEVLK